MTLTPNGQGNKPYGLSLALPGCPSKKQIITLLQMKNIHCIVHGKSKYNLKRIKQLRRSFLTVLFNMHEIFNLVCHFAL